MTVAAKPRTLLDPFVHIMNAMLPNELVTTGGSQGHVHHTETSVWDRRHLSQTKTRWSSLAVAFSVSTSTLLNRSQRQQRRYLRLGEALHTADIHSLVGPVAA